MPKIKTVNRPEGAPDSATSDTRERIFVAAERLFAERGFDGVSVRDIVEAAEANLAAVSYHFGSKGELLLSIFRKRTKEMNRERLTLLRDAEARNGGVAPLEDALRALISPPILWRDPAGGKDTASRFITRAITEATPELRAILESDVSHLRGFHKALAKALPKFTKVEVCWALHFTLALPHQCTDTNLRRLSVLSEGKCNTDNMSAIAERAVSFALGGIDAMARGMKPKSKRAQNPA